MDVTTDGDGWVDSLDVALLDEDLSGFGTEVFDLLFRDGLAFAKLGDLFVQETAHVWLSLFIIGKMLIMGEIL